MSYVRIWLLRMGNGPHDSFARDRNASFSAASAKLRSTFAVYKKVRSHSGITGAEAAQRILRAAGITDVQVVPIRGSLTDHYDPRTKTVSLSEDIYGRNSLAAVGVAAHECGHAIQDAINYAPLNIRSAIVPAANIGSQLSWPAVYRRTDLFH